MAEHPFPPEPRWTSDQIRSGEPFEISNGRLIPVLPAKRPCGDAAAWGAAVIKSDPKVKRAGVEVGVSTHPHMLRAPDVAVLSEDGRDDDWECTAPPLAIEYAGPGQDFTDLKLKIQELLDAGTRYMWVVRLDGPRRVEVYEPGKRMFVRVFGERLEAPGVLENDIPVESLFSADAAEGVILRNLLQRFGYQDLEAVRDEGLAEGLAEGRVEGLAEGRVEGETVALRQVSRRLLARRFPGFEDRCAALTVGLGLEALRWLVEAALDAESLDALGAQIEARASR